MHSELSTPIRLAIADDHPVFRQGVVSALAEQRDIVTVIQASNGKELLAMLPFHPVDIVLMDVKMPVMDGITTTRQLQMLFPSVRVLALSMYEEEEYLFQMIRAGAGGFLLKTASPDEIASAIRTMRQQEYYFNEHLPFTRLRQMLNTLPAAPLPEITEREKMILRLICQGKTNAEIAGHLCVSPRTMEGYREKLYEKTDCHHTAGLVMYAVRTGIVSLV